MSDFSKNKKFILAILFQITVIFIIIIFKVLTLNRGAEILLRVNPAEPRNPLRGDYIILKYDISDIPQSYFTYSPIKIGDNVFMPLIKRDGYFVLNNKASKNKPKNGIFIKGWVKETETENKTDCFLTKDCLYSSYNNSFVKIIYGIEEYYVPENKASELAPLMKNKNNQTYARIMVDRNGNAVIKEIFVNNKLRP